MCVCLSFVGEAGWGLDRRRKEMLKPTAEECTMSSIHSTSKEIMLDEGAEKIDGQRGEEIQMEIGRQRIYERFELVQVGRELKTVKKGWRVQFEGGSMGRAVWTDGKENSTQSNEGGWRENAAKKIRVE